jgi:hypothetical protein
VLPLAYSKCGTPPLAAMGSFREIDVIAWMSSVTTIATLIFMGTPTSNFKLGIDELQNFPGRPGV